MSKNKIILMIGILILLLSVIVVAAYFNEEMFCPNGNKILNWKEQTIIKFCRMQREKLVYIENVPTCYNRHDKTYLAYSSILEAMVKYCRKHSCPCPAAILSNNSSFKGTPEVLWGNKNICFVLFYGEGCPHCARELKILDKLYNEYNITIIKYEVYFHPDNAKLWQELAKKRNVTAQGVPTTFIGNYTFVGVLGDDEIREISKMISILPSLNVSTTTKNK